ncbi:RIPOR family member 3 [Aplochiton taeniatus]
MSVKLRFDCPSEGGVVHRSRSFTGFGSLTGRQRVSSARSSLRSKALSNKSPRVHLSPGRVGGAIWAQQPEQVDRIFQALRKGLKEYLDGHQTEMDFLSSQQRDSKRNSRLAFLYDLEKEIRALERYIRRLEFQISKVEELYETYCIQWRLCQGVLNMKRAFSLSPSSRASRESLLELNRNHRHSLEDMSNMEGELEILLGELHIKMKGLIGFARLCPGDQYEVVVRLGRQRWRIRGKIQSDDRQSWDEEEIVFLPHIHQNFEIKVTEVKGLGSLLVGMVTCKSADFFMARPQLMVVDITELGTIKLQLEVLWNPFDSAEMRPVSSSPSRQSLPTRKSSVYSWTTPNTPSFTDKYFLSMVRQLQDPEAPFPLMSRLESRSRSHSRGLSLLSYLADPSHQHHPNHHALSSSFTPSLPHSPSTSPTPSPSYATSLGGSQFHFSLAEDGPTETMGDAGEEEEWGGVSDMETTFSSPSSPSTPGESKRDSLLAFNRYSTPDILRKNGGGESPHLEPDSPAPGTHTLSGKEATPAPIPTPTPAPTSVPAQTPATGPGKVSSGQRRAHAVRLWCLLAQLEHAMESQSCSEKELRALDSQITHLATILKNNLSLLKTSSEETLAVEEVLGSFDFLSTDFSADDDTSCAGSLRLKDTGISSIQENTMRSIGLLSQSSQIVSAEELATAPLTSGNWSLDQALETHLDICSILLEALGSCDSPLSQRDVLEEMALQTNVLDTVSRLLLEKTDTALSASNVLPKAQKTRDILLFWEDCVYDGSPFCCHVDIFVRTLRKRYTHKVKAKQPGQSEAVFTQLLQLVQASTRMVPSPRPICSPDRVTLFQLSTYLARWAVQDLGEHISRLSKEVYLVSALRSPKRRRVLKKLKGRSIVELLPLVCTLQTVARLQTDSNHKVCKAAANCLSRAPGYKAFRTKAIVYYTECLKKQSDVRLQQAACLALKCLKATESVELVAELWRSEDEDLRSAARETVLSFGKKGHAAFQRMDQIYCELQEEAYRNQDTEITIL